MRRLARGVVLVCVVFGGSAAYAAPRELPRDHPILKVVKRLVSAFGNGLTIPGGKT